MSDSTSRNESITEEVPKALGKYLLDNVDGLKDYYNQFPAPNISIDMPSVSILFQSPDFTPESNPHPVVKTTPADIANHKSRIKWVVGQYDAEIQLDLWCRNKEERDDLTDAIFNALNPNITPMGLTLELEDYFGCLCDYLYVKHDFEDNQISSQTDEWRTIFRIRMSCKAIRERKEFIIEDSELQLETAPVSGDNFTEA